MDYIEKTIIFNDLVRQYDKLGKNGFLAMYNDFKNKKPLPTDEDNKMVCKYMKQIWKMNWEMGNGYNKNIDMCLFIS